MVLSTTLFEELKSSFGGEVAAEPWFNLVHLKRPISSAEREAWCSVGPTDDMTLPARNDFLCSDFEIRCAGAAELLCRVLWVLRESHLFYFLRASPFRCASDTVRLNR